MVTFAPVDLPDFQAGGLEAQIYRWVASEPMRALVAAYGETMPAGDLLPWLDAFSAEHWDFRRPGRVERDQVKAPAFEPELAALIRAAATALGMVEPARPPRASYEHLLVLGGLGRACLQRSEYAAELVLSGAVKVGEVAALGSFRPLTDAEKELPGLGEARFEVDAMAAAMRISFPEFPGISVLAAPSSESGKRANTADTYEYWAQRVHLRATDRILIVTTPIYVPFQHGDAIRILGRHYGCGIDTIGLDPARVTVPFAPGATDPDRYLQEIRSAIVSMRALW